MTTRSTDRAKSFMCHMLVIGIGILTGTAPQVTKFHIRSEVLVGPTPVSNNLEQTKSFFDDW